jgi:hypothetical protein
MAKHGNDYPGDSDLSDDDFEAVLDRERDGRYLDFAATVAIGAQAIHAKRRLQGELEKALADRDKWRKLCDEGDACRGRIIGDLVTGLASGVLTVDRSKPLPERLKEKMS